MWHSLCNFLVSKRSDKHNQHNNDFAEASYFAILFAMFSFFQSVAIYVIKVEEFFLNVRIQNEEVLVR